MDIPLDGEDHRDSQTDKEVLDFLEMHPLARIIVVVDTHCFQESGGFIWMGHDTDTYLGCTLWEVSSGLPQIALGGMANMYSFIADEGLPPRNARAVPIRGRGIPYSHTPQHCSEPCVRSINQQLRIA